MLIWNRQRFVREPVTGKRQARMSPEEEWVRKDVPELRIVDESLWRAVKSRQDAQEQEHGALRDAVRKAREAKSRDLTPRTSNFIRLLTCAVCGADFCTIGRDRYGCADHYRRKTCTIGQTLQRRVMEEQVRALFAETSALIRSQADAIGSDANLATRQLQGQMAKERRELEAVETRLSGLLAAIEDGLYTPRMKIRFLQLEDQAQRLKASLQIGARHMKAVQAQTGDAASEAIIIGLMADLRTSDDEYTILKLRRLFNQCHTRQGQGCALARVEASSDGETTEAGHPQGRAGPDRSRGDRSIVIDPERQVCDCTSDKRAGSRR